MKKTFGIIKTILFALVLSFVIGISFYSFSARMVGHNQMPMPFGVGVSVVLSGSMEPEFSAGDLIVVTEADDYAIKDIIVFQGRTNTIVHRIVDIDGDTFITRGDANNLSDKPIERSAIKGKVKFSLPYLGYLVLFLKSTPGTIIVLALTFFLFEYSIIREKREKRQKLQEIRDAIEEYKREQGMQ